MCLGRGRKAVRSEFAVYNRINVDYEGNFTEDNIRLATDDIPWKDKVSKAALYASYAPLRHLAYELGRIYPGT